MKVTVCQFDPRPEYLKESLNNLTTYVRETNSDFLLLPEMCFFDWLSATEILNTKRWEEAILAHDRKIAELTTLGARGVVGTRPILNQNGSRRNQAYVWSTETETALPLHEKYYLPNEPGYYEQNWYDQGEKSFQVGHVLGMRIGIQICTEMWFLEWARHYAVSKVDLLCVPRATQHESVDKWLAGGQTAAVCSGAYCLSSSLWTPKNDKVNLGGRGWIIDPEGNILATTDDINPFATIEINLEFARQSKATYPRYVPE